MSSTTSSSDSTYNKAQLEHYAYLEAIDSEFTAAVDYWILQERNARLEMFLCEYAHQEVQKTIMAKLEAEKSEPNILKCFGSCPQHGMENLLKRGRLLSETKDEVPAPKVPSKFNVEAPVFVPKSASGSSSPTGFNVSAPEFIPRGSSGQSTPTTLSSVSPPPASGDFAFNTGVRNSPKPGQEVDKYNLENGEFVVMAKEKSDSPLTSPPKKVKVFSPEELQKQNAIVEEMKKKFKKSL